MMTFALMLLIVDYANPKPSLSGRCWENPAEKNRDKNGTTGGHEKSRLPQSQVNMDFAASGSLKAEREGFSDGSSSADFPCSNSYQYKDLRNEVNIPISRVLDYPHGFVATNPPQTSW